MAKACERTWCSSKQAGKASVSLMSTVDLRASNTTVKLLNLELQAAEAIQDHPRVVSIPTVMLTLFMYGSHRLLVSTGLYGSCYSILY
jgi:hypothetical protein